MGYSLRFPLKLNPISNSEQNKNKRILVLKNLLVDLVDRKDIYFIDESPIRIDLKHKR